MGESLLVDAIGEDVLRRRNPEVATYARVDAVDVRVSATAEGGRTRAGAGGRGGRGLDAGPRPIRLRPGRRGLAGRRRSSGSRAARVAIAEIGHRGSAGGPAGRRALVGVRRDARSGQRRVARRSPTRPSLRHMCGGWAARTSGVGVRAVERAGDMQVTIAITDGDRSAMVERAAFLGGDQGRRRAANLACQPSCGAGWATGAGARPTADMTSGAARTRRHSRSDDCRSDAPQVRRGSPGA